jgi:hypothetical protein
VVDEPSGALQALDHVVGDAAVVLNHQDVHASLPG